MISVENLYFVLYHNLLGPTGVDCFYYFPFGTTSNLSHQGGEFQPRSPKHEHHVLFHFDQEPLYGDDLGQLYDNCSYYHSVKILKLLANSEHSLLKKQVCRTRSMMDWYFFYHGFAALDWFRDARYLGELQPPCKVFSSLNHIVTGKRSYRIALMARLLKQDLCQFGDVSFHGSKLICQQEVDKEYSYLSHIDKTIIAQHIIESSKTLPMVIDHAKIDGSWSARFGQREYRLWQNSLVHIVNETVFYDSKLHLTEKIFKPIVALRPFVLAAAPGNLAYLKHYGFQTFDTWIDESYDGIIDNDQRLDAITHEIHRLCMSTPRELDAMHKAMMPVLLHNKNHFFSTFKHQIINELVDNFDTCVRVWNHGRVDADRIVSPNYNTQLVKKILKQ